MKGKKFRDIRTGEVVKVIDSFENIAILENKQKIDVRRLGDTNYFVEEIDPRSFLNNRSAFESLTETIKNIPTDNMVDDGTVNMSNYSGQVRPTSDDSAVVYSSIEDEREELARKYGVIDNREATVRQQEALSRLIDDEELPTPPQQTYIPPVVDNNVQRVEVQRNEEGDVVQRPLAKPEDPIHIMFRNAKKVVEFSLDLTLNNKIPRLDFIEMMEDSYEKSIIDFLASEIANDLLKNPENLKFQISEKIKEMVYNKSVKKTTTRKKPIASTKRNLKQEKEEIKVSEVKKVTRKPRAKKETEQQ
jgi:hypothetical protein